MLSIDKIFVSYKRKENIVPVFKDFSLQVEEGEILAILGPSGCGKSTLIHVLTGMISVDKGQISMTKQGKKTSLNPKKHSISVIPQNFGLLPWKTVRKNCLLLLQLKKQPLDEKKCKELEDICNFLQISSLMGRYPKELSGGQMQRVALARAFLQEPDILLMDEPFSALDAITRMEACKLFLNVWERKKCTTILVTHSIEEALYLGNKILVLDKEEKKQIKQIENSYFGQLQVKDEKYLTQKNELYEMLQQTVKEVAK